MKSSEELGRQVGVLVEQYMETGRREAEAAMARAFGKGSVRTRKRSHEGRRQVRAERRTAEALTALAEELYAAIRERPGEKMAVLATEMEASPRELHLPMMALRHEGRVRSVGQRQHTRYFPTAPSSTGK